MPFPKIPLLIDALIHFPPAICFNRMSIEGLQGDDFSISTVTICHFP
ncbi:hypothetical protein NBRC111894_2674 [Sporolactobacillus inulinus]|uniref:Uncharacterized protein n=1 Tax=Sporolactobacillus inulinus TaxID=2078 RepID=A0A4Y1ZDT0_9BACL|nr:hypothetical protein NBRC111894_2674 [Sporolactobacillus inulinus]